LAHALAIAGVAARVCRLENESLAGADCLHLFGSCPEHLGTVDKAHRQNVKVVLSPQLGLGAVENPRRPWAVARRVANWALSLGQAACPRLISWRRRLYGAVDLLLPNSNAEAAQLMRRFGVPAGRIFVVPHGADPQLAAADPEPFVRHAGLRDFVLSAGPIAPEENQLGLLWAMHRVDLPIVVLGNAAAGKGWYLSECRRVAGDRARFLPQIGYGNPLLASAFAAAKCLVRVSWAETLPPAVLAAAMTGAPLVLPEGGCAGEYFGRQALYVRPDDLPGIRTAVFTAMERGRSKDLAQHVRTYFSWHATAKTTREAYLKLLQRDSP
jgi:glycosyltransferase involved in cell wall biosynthesis